LRRTNARRPPRAERHVAAILGLHRIQVNGLRRKRALLKGKTTLGRWHEAISSVAPLHAQEGIAFEVTPGRLPFVSGRAARSQTAKGLTPRYSKSFSAAWYLVWTSSTAAPIVSTALPAAAVLSAEVDWHRAVNASLSCACLLSTRFGIAAASSV
jgi:hypothetical protein